MNLPDLIRFQLAHSSWALRELIAAAATLPPSRLEEDLNIGPGPLRANIAHTIEVMFFFADNFAGREYTEPPHFASQSQSLAGLRALLAEADDKLRSALLAALARGLGDRILWPNAPEKSLPTSTAIAQTFDHAALHRTQCINMLKRLGVQPVPDLDPMTFASTGAQW